MQATTGQLVSDRYRLLHTLGGDAAFSRWLAQDMGLGGVLVEIAFLPSEIAGSRRAYAGIKDAAILSLKLLHTNIASTRAFDDNDGAPFIVFDHVEGRPLGECLDEWGKLGEEEAKAFLAPLASALDYAHGKDILHRDIRPSNIIVDADAVPHFVGFCTACAMRETVAQTRGGSAAGPITWLSPEQLLGREPDKAQDIYSFAAIAYECIGGHPPFHRGQIEYQIVNASPEPLKPETPFTRAIMRGLSKDPAARQKSCAELLAGDFARIPMPEVVSAIPVNIPKARRPQQQQQPWRDAPACPPQRQDVRPTRIEPPNGLPPMPFGPSPAGAPPHQMPPRNGRAGHPPARGRHIPGPPPVPVHASRKVPTQAEREARQKRLDAVQERRRRSREMEERDMIANAEFRQKQSQGATRKAIWVFCAIGVLAAVAALVSSFAPKTNVELANAPVKKAFSQEDLGPFTQFMGIEFGKIIPEIPDKGDSIVFGNTTNLVTSVSLTGLAFDVELAEPVFKVFPVVRISLVQTPEGRRIAGLTFEKSGEGIKAEKARKVVTKIASLLEKEYGFDMGDTLTAINDTYFGQRYSDNLVDIRISSVVSPDSTSISFSLESRVVHAQEIVGLR